MKSLSIDYSSMQDLPMWKVLSFLSLVQRDEILEFEEKTSDHETHLNLLIASQSKKGVNQVRKELQKQKTMYRKVNEDVEPDENAIEVIKAMNKK